MTAMLYSLRDIKAGYYMNMFILRGAVDAQRTFIAIVEDNRSPIAKHPKDYAIYEMGAIDVESGEITPLKIPKDVTPHSEVEAVITMTLKAK